MGIRGYGLGYDIILQIGDSNSYAGVNADGSKCYDPAIDTVDPNCFEYRGDGLHNPPGGAAPFFSVVANSIHPLDYAPALQTLPADAYNGVGPGEGFVKAWQSTFAAPGRKTMIVAHCVGGTGLCNGGATAWQATAPVGNDLTYAIQKVNLILAKSALNKLVCILWTCGANDGVYEKSTGLSTATYQTAFQAMAAYLRANIVGTGASVAPILIQPLVPAFVANAGTACPNTNTALSTMPSVVSKCGYVDPTAAGLNGNILGTNSTSFHLTGGSNRLIGNPGFVNAYNARSA